MTSKIYNDLPKVLLGNKKTKCESDSHLTGYTILIELYNFNELVINNNCNGFVCQITAAECEN